MIVIPMAGASSRFNRAGYKKPKYQLKVRGVTLFEHAVGSFRHYFDTRPFLFVIQNNDGVRQFVTEKACALGIQDFTIIGLSKFTRGQAETVSLGLQQLDYTGPLTIFNIDTFRPGFVFPEIAHSSDGYLEVVKASGKHWSFVKPLDNRGSTQVDRTAEKKRISDLCSTGLYHFNQACDFVDAFEHYQALPVSEWEKGELYIAPLYNWLIDCNKVVHYHLIAQQDVIFCGTPDEYMDLLSSEYI